MGGFIPRLRAKRLRQGIDSESIRVQKAIIDAEKKLDEKFKGLLDLADELKDAAVLQEDSLFAGSLADNIALFDDEVDMQMVVNAAAAASIHDDIAAMPMQYETLIGDIRKFARTLR